MPRRLAFTGAYAAELLDYDPPAPEPDQVRIRTTWASGKIGTTAAIFDNSAFRDHIFDTELRLFLDSPGADSIPTPQNPSNSGTTGVGVVEAVGANVTRLRVGETVFGYMDIREVNTRPVRLHANLHVVVDNPLHGHQDFHGRPLPFSWSARPGPAGAWLLPRFLASLRRGKQGKNDPRPPGDAASAHC